MKTKVDELKSELIDYCEFTEEDVDAMSRYELFDKWLKYNGIIGYTDDIIKMLSCASGVNLVSKLGNE
jgi:hypothetical protein